MTTTEQHGVAAVRSIVGDGRAREAAAADAIRGVLPLLVVEPADARQLSDVLAAATASGLTVAPRGGGTKLDWGNRPARVDLVVSTARLNQVVEHAWADLTVTVQAGCTIQTLQDTLRTRGQRVAVDPLWPERATVGGVLATNDSGALRLRCGGLRDLIIGSTIALSDGTLASSGGKVVKNVAGYDVSKLATGALGTLGIMTSAIFRLHPRPQRTRTVSAVVRDLAGMQRIIESLQDSKLVHAALQTRAAPSIDPIVDILFEGSDAGISAQIDHARTLTPAIQLDDADPAVWQARQDLWSSGGPVVKLSVPMSELARTLDTIRRTADAAGTEWQAVFQATGIGCVGFPPVLSTSSTSSTSSKVAASTPSKVAAWVEMLRHLRASVGATGGTVTVLRTASADEATDSWPDAGDALPVMEAVKHQFDPKRTLNPGRFVGGI